MRSKPKDLREKQRKRDVFLNIGSIRLAFFLNYPRQNGIVYFTRTHKYTGGGRCEGE